MGNFWRFGAFLVAMSLQFSPTWAQIGPGGGVQQSGSVTANDCVAWAGNGSIKDAGSACAGGGTPGGSAGQVQFNNAGAFGGISGATSNGTTITLVAPILGIPASGNLANTTGYLASALSGIVPAANGGAGSVTGALKGNGSGVVSQAACADVSNGGTFCSAAAATKADEQAGSSAVVVTTPSQQQQHDSAAKAWVFVTQSAGTYTIQSSYNVTNLTKIGTGDVGINFTTPFASANFVAVCAVSSVGGGSIFGTSGNPSASEGEFTMRSVGAAPTATDANFGCVFYGRQ